MQVFIAYHTSAWHNDYTLGVFSSRDLARARIETFSMNEAKADCEAEFIPGCPTGPAHPGRIKKAFDEYFTECWVQSYNLDGKK